MSMNNQGYKYDAHAMLTLNEVSEGRYIAGTCVAVRTSGKKKGEFGRAYGYAPAVGVCPEGSKNRHEAKTRKVQGGYLILDDGSGNIVIHKSRDKAREVAHKRIQSMGAAKLATYSPEQRATIEAIKVLRSSIAKLNASLQVMSEAGIPTDNIDTLITDQRNQITTLEATL